MSCNLTEHLETQFIKPGGIYIRYLSDKEVYEKELADLSMIVELIIEKIKRKHL